MIDHVSFYALDFPKSRAFYEVVMATLGCGVHAEMVMTWDEDPIVEPVHGGRIARSFGSSK